MLQSLRSVQAFLDDYSGKLADVVKTGARQRLDDAIAELSTHASEQTGNILASQGSTQKQRALRLALLRDHMAPIARAARSDLPQTPEIAPLRLPRGRPTIERLAAAAFGMAKAAAPFSNVFVAAGLSTDFIAQLEGAANALLSSLNDRAQSHGKRSGATKGLKSRLTGGRKIVHILDAFVRSALKDDPALLANWNAVKRVRRVTGRRTVVTPPAGPTAANPTTTSATAAPAPNSAPHAA